jgi:hypothetical protein
MSRGKVGALTASRKKIVKADSVAPTAPTGLTAVGAIGGFVFLSFSASSDNVGVTGYEVYLDGGGGPVAASNGLTIQLQGVSPGNHFVSVRAVDASGNKSELSNVANFSIQESLRSSAKKEEKTSRRFFTSPFNAPTSTATPTANTSLVAYNLPAKFKGIRLGYLHQGGNGATIGTKFLIAETDHLGNYDYANINIGGALQTDFRRFITPEVNGTEFNSIASGTARGWKAVTFAGASSINIPDPGAGNNSVTWSDFIPIDSVASLQDPTVFPLLVRTFHGTGPYTRQTGGAALVTGTNWVTDVLKYNGKASSRAADGVADPTAWTRAMTPNADIATAPTLIIEMFAEEEQRSVLMVGDSRLSISTELTASKNYLGLPYLLQNEMVKLGIKGNILSFARSGTASSVYQPVGMTVLSSGNATPSHALYLFYSVNDGAVTGAVLEAAFTRAKEFFDRCKVLGIKSICLVDFPGADSSTLNAATILLLELYKERLNAIADVVISAREMFGNPAQNYAYNTGYGGTALGLASHMSQFGYQALAKSLAECVL